MTGTLTVLQRYGTPAERTETTLDWFTRRGDVDVLAVAGTPADRAVQARLGGLLAGAGTCPGTGLELSVITAATAADLGRCRFEVHVTTGADPKVVTGADYPGDPDLVLHTEVCRRAGYAVHGPSPAQVFAPVAAARLRAAVAAELDWGMANGSVPYLVLMLAGCSMLAGLYGSHSKACCARRSPLASGHGGATPTSR